MARHPSRDRVDRVADIHATLGEDIGQLANAMLSLSHGETVARHNDDPLSVGQRYRCVLDADLADRLRLGGPAGSCPRRRPSPEGTEDDIGHLAVHRSRHQQGEQRA